jgi:hypothetical protein
MLQTALFTELPQATGTLRSASSLPSLKLDQVKTQWDAFQSLRQDLESMIARLGDIMASASLIHATFGITPTTVRRLAAHNRVRKVGRRRKRYHVSDVLLAVLHCGTGRIRRPRTTAPHDGQLRAARNSVRRVCRLQPAPACFSLHGEPLTPAFENDQVAQTGPNLTPTESPRTREVLHEARRHAH